MPAHREIAPESATIRVGDGRRRGRVKVNFALCVRIFHEIAQRWQVRAEDFPDEGLDTDLCFALECTGSGRQLPLECNQPTLLALESASSNRPTLNRLGGVICQICCRRNLRTLTVTARYYIRRISVASRHSLGPPSTVALYVLNHKSTAVSTIGFWERHSNRT